MQRSHNLPLPLRIYPPFKHLHATLPEFTLRPKIYPHFKNLRPPQNLPLPPRIGYPPFLTTTCNTSKIHPSLSEYTPFYIKCGSQNLPHLSRIYPFFYSYMRCSQNLPRPPGIYPPPLLEMRPSQNLPILPESTPFFTTICDTPIIDPSLP